MSRLYDSVKWKRLRAWVIQNEPLCRMCAEEGRLESAQVVDHIHAHRGDPVLFYDTDNLQPLCKACHDKRKQQEERSGFKRDIGEDGWPMDERHPVNSGKQAKKWDATAWIPPDIPKLEIPSVFLCGPPASGKTTWALKHKSSGTLVLDPDITAQELGLPAAWEGGADKTSRRRIARREMARLRSAADSGAVDDVIIVRSAPRPITRTRWVEALGPEAKLKVLRTPLRVCYERIMADPQRRKNAARQMAAVRGWYAADRA
ncbi:MAG: HNH endonuclease [Gammaproteobacteria bacterium]|nr:HNH endonuclease [Gammaproteobacteria bacterium]